MSFDIPDDLYYTESHEWLAESDGTVRIGISDFAQDELGDIVFVELPAEGDDLDVGDAFATVESIKAVSDVYAPISGTVTAANDALLDAPEAINEDPYGDGWLLELDGDLTDDLLDADDYAAQIE
ncbi:glycine cleavage system protein GcvH [Haloarculaceae archaeon H-GB2-1]|nr:glycine cleavage system protein GcvH [Haloarculaceae archaeon H-GB1-1]MEA5387945.1 glycine cleavage system protein GcvH [Haloarculaceae archaeon H-GB11]MEA5409437.1 glycine cleavage system protein GcvH [Haloarculaceae archaeon H-GB2-1]